VMAGPGTLIQLIKVSSPLSLSLSLSLCLFLARERVERVNTEESAQGATQAKDDTTASYAVASLAYLLASAKARALIREGVLVQNGSLDYVFVRLWVSSLTRQQLRARVMKHLDLKELVLVRLSLPLSWSLLPFFLVSLFLLVSLSLSLSLSLFLSLALSHSLTLRVFLWFVPS